MGTLELGSLQFKSAPPVDTGGPISPRSAAGAERLRYESDVDETVRRYVAEHGAPEYLFSEERGLLYFFYTRADRVAVFRRALPPSDVETLPRIPGTLLKLLPKPEIDRLLAHRKAQRAARAPVARKRPVPASRQLEAAPGAARTLRGFDVDALVARLRAPMTAADAGVSGWRGGRLADGRQVRTARSGSTQWELRSDRVTFSARIGSGQTSTPGAARVAYVRLNQAVYGLTAEKVNPVVQALAARVAADPSGRTRFAQRLGGRTVRIGRVAAQGLLVYSIDAE